jgi:hypothetical protein
LQIKQTPPLPPPPSPPLGIAISSLVRANIIYTDDHTIFGLDWLHNVDHLHIQLVCSICFYYLIYRYQSINISLV